ncbi:nucleoside-diphosphate kinase [candidate division KSB1 bacterium]|nr:nucleoside-diphosphate kinase [candidate division KSB1 bacterium]
MERTLAILKPDCYKRKLTGAVLEKIEKAGFTLVAAKIVKMTKPMAESFYEVHRDKNFFPALVEFMTENRCLVAVIEKENAIEDYRKLMGSTDPAKADSGTIRKEYAESIQRNIVHGSDSPENAIREINFFFSGSELLG